MTWKYFEEIESWQIARDFNREVFLLINETKLSRDFSLSDQINRSAGSVMDNIAEGFGRGGSKEFITFLGYSKGSICESRSQLFRIFDREYISESHFQSLKSKTFEIENKIGGLIAYLNKTEIKGIKFKKQVTSNNKQQTTNNKQQTTNNKQ